MQKIELRILAQDIKDNGYFGGDRCPITRALARAGYPHLRDAGYIKDTTKIEDEECRVMDVSSNETYKALVFTLLGMYSTKDDEVITIGGELVKQLPIEDFTHTLIF